MEDDAPDNEEMNREDEPEGTGDAQPEREEDTG